ncbi:MAG: hypothetical protein ACI4JM_12075 [Oscillospiraceae bacterium]
MEKNKKSLLISAAVFSAVYIVIAIVTADVYTALINIVLWGCMCLGQNWARVSKIAIDIILICVYAVSLWQIFMSSDMNFKPDNSLISAIAINTIVPVIELIVIYKSKGMRDYFIEQRKNKINIKR